MPKAGTKASAAAKPPAKKPTARRKVNGYERPENIPLGEIITDLSKQQWKIGPSIGAGGFGDIYCACKVNEAPKKHDDYQYVVKIEPHGNGPLFVEMHFYMRNAKFTDIETFRKKHGLKTLGMPHFIGHGSHHMNNNKHRFIVLPRFGDDIWNKFLTNGEKFPLHTVYRLAIQMLDAYEYIHGCAYVHGDLKGSNMLLGLGKNGKAQAYLVDFGLAVHTANEYKPDPKKMHNGTIEYTSRDAHKGIPTMRGDIEILAYNLIQWAGGKLPWITKGLLTQPIKVQQAKEDFMNDINKNIRESFGKTACPEPILSFLNAIAKMKFDDKPNYTKFKKDFLAAIKSFGKSDSGDLEFSASLSPKKGKSARELSKITEHTEDDTENSPKNKRIGAKKRSSPPNDELNTSKRKYRGGGSPPKISKQNTQVTPTSDPTIIVNNQVNSKCNKTYELNFELDISFDANVIVNVKRKKKTVKVSPKKTESQHSTDEIPNTEQSNDVATAKISKRVGTRISPRTKK